MRVGGAKNIEQVSYGSRIVNVMRSSSAKVGGSEVMKLQEGTHHTAVEVSAVQSVKDSPPCRIDHLGLIVVL